MKMIDDLRGQFFQCEESNETYNSIVGDEKTWRERGCPTEPVTGPRIAFINVDSLSEADGVRFLCPKCFSVNKGEIGTHRIHIYFSGKNTPPSVNNGVRWDVTGTGLHDLTITPSILLGTGCAWHGFITNGEAT